MICRCFDCTLDPFALLRFVHVWALIWACVLLKWSACCQGWKCDLTEPRPNQTPNRTTLKATFCEGGPPKAVKWSGKELLVSFGIIWAIFDHVFGATQVVGPAQASGAGGLVKHPAAAADGGLHSGKKVDVSFGRTISCTSW